MNMHSDPVPLRPDARALASSQRRSFVRAATAMALAAKHRQRPDVILGKTWPDDSAAPRVLKTATTPTTSRGFQPMQTVRAADA